jgi:hypothetical protein
MLPAVRFTQIATLFSIGVAAACHGDPVGEALPSGGAGGMGAAASGGTTGGSGGISGSGGAAGSAGAAGTAGAGGCVASCSVELAPPSYVALELAVDATDVYFVTSAAGIVKVNKGGGKPASFASGKFWPALALDGSFVYAFDGTDSHPMKINKTSGAPLSLGTGNGIMPTRAVLAGGLLYWSAYPGPVERVSVLGGNVETLTATGNDPYGMAVDANRVWFTNKLGQSVKQQPLAGGSELTLATGLLSPGDLALANGSLYLGDVAAILSLDPATPGSPTPIKSGVLPSRIAVDTTHVYWNSTTAEHVARTALSGNGPVEVIADGLKNPGAGFALDDAYVYFVDDGGVYGAPKSCCVATQP